MQRGPFGGLRGSGRKGVRAEALKSAVDPCLRVRRPLGAPGAGRQVLDERQRERDGAARSLAVVEVAHDLREVR